MRLFCFRVLFSVLLALGAALPALAAQEQPPSQLAEVVVSGRQIEERLSAELAEYGHPVTVITGQQIEEAGYADLYQALEGLAPGLFIAVKTGRGDYARQYLHGSETILWLIDGVRINNRLYGKGYLDLISVHLIDRVEVLYGGEGLFYGTEATAGVINVITKPITKQLSGQVGAAAGSYRFHDTNAYVSESWDNHGLMVFASNDGWQGYQHFDDQVFKRMGNGNYVSREYWRTNLGAKYRGELDLAGKAVINLHFQRDEGEFEYAYPNMRQAVNDRTQDLFIFKLDHDITPNFSYYIKSFMHRWWTDYTRQRLTGVYDWKDANWGFQDWGVNLLSSYRFGDGHELLAGLDYQNYYGDDAVTDIYTEHEEVKAIFAQLRPHLAFLPKLKTGLGLRYNQTGEYDKTIWNFSARHPLVKGVFVRGNVGTSFVLPTAEQLWRNDQDSGRYGNPDLKPQESFNLDLGLEGTWGLFHWDVGLFQQDMKDRISTSGDTYVNIAGESTVRGYEAGASVGPWQGFTLGGSYTYTQAEADGSTGQLDRIPEYFAKVYLAWRQPVAKYLLGADITGRYVGPMWDYGVQYGRYWTADWSAFVAFGADKRHRVNLRLENILDERYASQIYKGTDALGQSYIYEGLGVPFNVVLSYTFTF